MDLMQVAKYHLVRHEDWAAVLGAVYPPPGLATTADILRKTRRVREARALAKDLLAENLGIDLNSLF